LVLDVEGQRWQRARRLAAPELRQARADAVIVGDADRGVGPSGRMPTTDQHSVRELSLAMPDITVLPPKPEVCVMRLSDLRRQMAKVRAVVRNPQEVEKLHQIMERIQRLEKDWETRQ
jgi:hypothetical protein